MHPFVRPIAFGGLLILLSGCNPPRDRDVRIVTWNAEAVFTVEDVRKRSADFKALAAQLKPTILLLQEVTSTEVVRALRDEMGLKGYYIACSDFAIDGKQFDSLEVAIVSAYPLLDVIEYDPTPDRHGPDNANAVELQLPDVTSFGIRQENVGRGYLWASIPDLNLTVAVVHLKSSRGKDGREDVENALKRETVIGAVALGVLADRSQYPDFTYVVAGDFNVGHSDRRKNGRNLRIDSIDAGSGQDLYDDTHAILSDGIMDDLRMTNLTLGITDATYPSFPGSPIDNIYVAGREAGRFDAAQKSTSTFGSDHTPVWTTYRRP